VQQLRELVERGKSIEELCEIFKRTPEALRLKLKRLGVAVPETLKEVETTTTPQQTLPPLKSTEDLISAEEALKMWLGCIKRLNQPGLTATELKRIRIILQALKSYIIVTTDYYERLRDLEQGLDEMREHMIEYFQVELNRAQTQEERIKWQKSIDELKTEKQRNIEWLQKPFTIWPRH
jgi:hypothetical protein